MTNPNITKNDAFNLGRDLRINNETKLNLVMFPTLSDKLRFNVRSLETKDPNWLDNTEVHLVRVPGSVAVRFIEGYYSLTQEQLKKIRQRFEDLCETSQETFMSQAIAETLDNE